MRDDLTKVLCEAERPRSWDHYSNYRNLKAFKEQYDEDDEPFSGICSGHRESMKFRYGWDQKSFGEHLSPLHGIVRKNVGRKWDDVYSELTQNFDRRSATGNHIFQHLYDQLVDPKFTFIGDDGQVYVRGRYNPQATPIRESSYEFFVDPRDGILKRNSGVDHHKQLRKQREQEKARQRDAVLRVIDKDTELHLINGVWFEVKFRTFDGVRKQVEVKTTYTKRSYIRTEMEYPYTFDVLKRQTVSAARVAVSKRTVNHRDLKRHGLVA